MKDNIENQKRDAGYWKLACLSGRQVAGGWMPLPELSQIYQQPSSSIQHHIPIMENAMAIDTDRTNI